MKEFILEQLPYEKNALEPHISEDTVSFHYGKHHAGYVQNLNNLLKDNPDFTGDMTLEEIIIKSSEDQKFTGIFNNAAQVFNHDFYWKSMSPKGGGEISYQNLSDKIVSDFGSFTAFKDEFKKACLGQFGSGWAWLVLDNGKLAIVKTANADCPIVKGLKPILVCDVWEHAYYLDYQNKRADYVDVFLNHLVNWSFAAKNLSD